MMVMARLHIICGNCGSNEFLEWNHSDKHVIDGEVINDEDVSIHCRNCSTIHSLNDNAELEVKDK